MPKWLLALLALWIPIAVAGWWWYASDAQVTRREFNALNLKLNAATESKNIPALTQFLQDTLDEKVMVSLKVEHTILGIKSGTVLLTQDFTKADFIRFMELTLEPMENYTLHTRIEAITKEDASHYTVNTYANGNGNADEYMRGMRIPTSHTVQVRCTFHAQRAPEAIHFTRMQCDVGLNQSRSMP